MIWFIAPPVARFLSAELRELMASAPHPDNEFADDVRAVRESAGPPGDPWPS